MMLLGVIEARLIQTPSVFKAAPAGPTYSRLNTLRSCPDPKKKIRFSKTKGDREHLIKKLKGCIPALPGECRETLESLVLADGKSELPEQILEQANRLHAILSRNWSCSCAVTSRQVYLHLATLHGPKDFNGFTKFDLLFSASDERCDWQEGEIFVRIPKYG
jgi:hypothetical protein